MDKERAYKRRIEREIRARKQAEAILESKALELWNVNESLKALNSNLEEEINRRSQELTLSEEKYRSLVEQASDILFNVNQEGYFTYMNAPGYESFGFTLEEVIGSRYIEYVPEEHRLEVFTYYAKLISENKQSDYYEFPVLNKKGETFWIGQNVNRVTNKDGTFFFSAVARDITKRRETEQALDRTKKSLVKSEVKYRSILYNMELGVIEVDKKGQILKSYDHFNRMSGYSSEELIGKNALTTLVKEGYRELIRDSRRSDAESESFVAEIEIIKNGGEEMWVLFSTSPFYNENNEIEGYIGISYDLTIRKNLETELKAAKEEAVKAQQAEKQFLASMSHEIRTPLNAIIGMTHLISDTPLNDEQLEYLEILNSSAGILKNLISDILDISKIDAGRLEVNPVYYDLKEDILNIVNTFSVKIQQKNLVLDYAIDKRIETEIYTDRQLISQVLMNLISNAEKFTETGGIDVKVEVTNETDTSLDLLFEVKDTGIGMTEEEAQVVFTEFKQAKKEIRTKYGGTGLGLSICKRFLNLLDSDLQVMSTPGKGSTFFFKLKVIKGKPLSGTTTSLKQKTKVRFDNPELKVLVVDDNKLNIRYASTLLSKWNLDHDIAMNGQEAVEKVKGTDYDLVLMDLQMPVMDGFEATKVIRGLPESKASVPIIALTASTFLSKKQMAQNAGMSDFLSKPFTPNELMGLLVEYLNIEKDDTADIGEFKFNKLLDAAYLQEAYQGDFEYAAEMFETFIEVANDELTLLEKIRHGDLKTIASHAHKIKPIFTMVGLGYVTEIVATLEKQAKENNEVQTRALIAEVLEESKKTMPIIKEDFSRLSKVVSS